MDRWPNVVNAEINQAPQLLRETADQLMHPQPILALILVGVVIVLLSSFMQEKAFLDQENRNAWLIASSALKTTLWIDGLFLITALIQPGLSGLI